MKLRVTQRWNPGFDPDGGTAGPIDESKLSEEKVTDYIGNKIYENGELKRVLVPGGYYDAEAEKYKFYLSDHLGNNRVVVDEDGEVIQQTHYYPFGASFAESTGENKQPYKYNGKELDSKHGLNLYDYSARYYEPTIGRFTTMDPLAEKYYSISPYAYVANNPISRIDPFGMDYWTTSDPDEIKRFLEAFFVRQNNEVVLEMFNFSSWNQLSNNSGSENLTFNDETGTFYSSFAYFDDAGEVNVVGVSTESVYINEENALFGTPLGLLFVRDYGGLTNVYPEYDIFKLGTKTGWQALKYLWKQAVNPVGNINSSGFGKGSTKSERKINQKRYDASKERERKLRELKKTSKTKAEKNKYQKQIDHEVNVVQKKSEVHWN